MGLKLSLKCRFEQISVTWKMPTNYQNTQNWLKRWWISFIIILNKSSDCHFWSRFSSPLRSNGQRSVSQKCPSIAKISVPERTSGSPNAHDVAKVLNVFCICCCVMRLLINTKNHCRHYGLLSRFNELQLPFFLVWK